MMEIKAHKIPYQLVNGCNFYKALYFKLNFYHLGIGQRKINIANRIKTAKHLTLEWKTVLDHPSGLGVITWGLQIEEGSKTENQRDSSVRKIWPDVAGFESGRVGP